MTFTHIPVLYKEVLETLNIQPNGRYIDCTLGAGGHTEGIIAHGGRVLAFDLDPEAIEYTKARFGEKTVPMDHVTFVNASYTKIGKLAPKNGFDLGSVDGILMDLGLSSRQLDNPERGFSFRHSAPLDMRFNTQQGKTAADLVNTLSEYDLANIFWRYGDEKQSRKFARAIVTNRPIHTTKELADLITSLSNQRAKIHPATKLFQALRIAVNDELENLEKGLDAALKLLKIGGRLAIISFHSLEDRYVKNRFRDLSTIRYEPPDQPVFAREIPPVLKRITRKPIVPSESERQENSRSRSAKLRVVEKIGEIEA